VWRDDPQRSKPQTALRLQQPDDAMRDMDAEVARKTGRSEDVLRMERCAARGEQESGNRRYQAALDRRATNGAHP